MSNANVFFTKSESLANMSRMNIIQFLQSFLNYIFPNNTALLNLTLQLSNWNSHRITTNSHTQELSIDDVALIKRNIDSAINRSSAKYSDVFSDQLLFLVIGAIQIESQTNSYQAWHLVNQCIKNTIESNNEKRIFQLSIFSTPLLICLSAILISNSKINEMRNSPLSYSVEESITETDPVTISMLELAFKKMKNGTCQLPQAAMLPIEQRSAYLNFINKGVIEVQHVENLRIALGYVNCLYPQELMHPRLPDEK